MQGFGIGIDKEGRSVVSGMGSMANSITEAFNSNLAVPDITSNMKKVNANMNAQVHTYILFKQTLHNVLFVLKWT